MNEWKSPCGSVELRLGDGREVLGDVSECGAVITDPPYGDVTHAGNQGMRERFGSAERRSLSYAHMTPEDVAEFALSWSPRCSGWIAAMTSDDLAPVYRAEFGAVGRYAFAPVGIVAPRVRLGGDGPASALVYLMVSRPRARRFSSWGALPGWYKAGIDRSGHIGGKPLGLMRAIVSDYSRPGDLVVDPYAGAATTLIAAAEMGRRAIGAEVDPETFEKAVARLEKGWTVDAFAASERSRAEQPEMFGGES